MNHVTEKKLNNKGFSLVELIIVIAIMAVLIGVLAPQYLKYVDKSRESADLDNYQTIVSALQICAVDSSAGLSDGKIVFKADGTCDSTNSTAAIVNLLKNEGGVDVTKLTMKSSKYKTATITVKKDATTGVYKFTVNNSDLANALAIETTPVAP